MQRVAVRVMYPRATKVHRTLGQGHSVQPAPDPMTRLQNRAVNACVRHSVSDRQAGNACTNHQHPVDPPDDASRDLGVSVVATR